MAKKSKLITKPANLGGLGIGDKIRIGKESFIIKDIRQYDRTVKEYEKQEWDKMEQRRNNTCI